MSLAARHGCVLAGISASCLTYAMRMRILVCSLYTMYQSLLVSGVYDEPRYMYKKEYMYILGWCHGLTDGNGM